MEETACIPDRKKCFSLIKQVRMPDHIIQHSLLVEDIALRLASMCIRRGFEISLELVSTGALLHDIAKARCIEEQCHHAQVGAEMVDAWGYPAVADVVRDHVTLSLADIITCPTEALLVNYADKRVLHDSIVSLDHRFKDLIERYGKTQIERNILQYKWRLYKKLESRLIEITECNISLPDFFSD